MHAGLYTLFDCKEVAVEAFMQFMTPSQIGLLKSIHVANKKPPLPTRVSKRKVQPSKKLAEY